MIYVESVDYTIDKHWLRGLLDELYEFLLTNRKKKPYKPKKGNNKETEEQHMSKKDQEILFRRLETDLFELFDKSTHPFWLNLFFIENSKDYAVNKYYTLSCCIAKLFERWVNANKTRANTFKLSEEIRTEAFLVSCRHNLLLIDYICGLYQLDIDNQFLLDLAKARISTLDFKDKAILIGTLRLHDSFDMEQITLPLLLQDKLNVLEKYLSNSTVTQTKFIEYLDKMCSKNVSLNDYLL